MLACCLTATASDAAVLTGQFRSVMPRTGPKSKMCGWPVGSLLTNSNCFEDTFLPCHKGNTILVWKTGLLKKQGRSSHLGDSSFCLSYLERVFRLSKLYLKDGGSLPCFSNFIGLLMICKRMLCYQGTLQSVTTSSSKSKGAKSKSTFYVNIVT